MTDINENIEYRLKQIQEKLQKDFEKKMDQKLKQEKKEMLDKLLHMYPILENDKDSIIDACLLEDSKTNKTSEESLKDDDISGEIDKENGEIIDKKDEEIVHKNINAFNPDNKPLVFDQIVHNGEIYYKDELNKLWNSSAELVGFINGEEFILYDTGSNEEMKSLEELLEQV